jgi:hypothetical protein
MSSTKKLDYLTMITDAIFTLGERKGSSRAAIWKYVSTKFPVVARKDVFNI